jgi:uncharacterized membrane protein YqiK
MGISVVSYTLKDVHDEGGYLQALGMKRESEVRRDARIGEAEAQRDAAIKVFYRIYLIFIYFYSCYFVSSKHKPKNNV